MPAAGDYKQAIKFLQQLFGRTIFLYQARSFSVMNPPLEGTLVQAPKHIFQFSSQVQPVKKISGRCKESRLFVQLAEVPFHWTNLEILPPLRFQTCLQRPNQEEKFFAGVEQRIAMVREWKRNKAAPRKPAVNFAANQPVVQLCVWRRSGKRHRGIFVSEFQCPEPTCCVENTGARVPIHQHRPPWVQRRVNLVDFHCRY